MQRLTDLCPGRPDTIRLEDWKALKDLASLSVLDVEHLFYPGAPPELLYQILEDETQGRPYRSTKFLTTLSDAEYYAAYDYVQGSPEVETAQRFPDVEAILSRGRKEGRILSQVMSQVAQWINPSPMVVDPRQPDKPQRWRDFIPAFAGIPSEDAQHAARELQRNIFNVVRGRFEELDQVWDGNVACPTYPTRFQSTPIWHELLAVVHAAVGPRFVGQMERANKGLPPQPSSNSKPALIYRVCEAICRLPEVSRNPALRDPAATNELTDLLSPLVAKWVVEWCDRGLTAQANSRTRPWRPSDLELVQAERLAMSALAQVNAPSEDQRSPGRTTDGAQSRVGPPESLLDPSSVVSSTQSPARPNTSQPVAPSDPISSLLPSGAETAAAMRKAFRGRVAQQPRTPLPAGALSRASLAVPGRIRSPATTAATRPKLAWASGPATQPDHR